MTLTTQRIFAWFGLIGFLLQIIIVPISILGAVWAFLVLFSMSYLHSAIGQSFSWLSWFAAESDFLVYLFAAVFSIQNLRGKRRLDGEKVTKDV